MVCWFFFRPAIRIGSDGGNERLRRLSAVALWRNRHEAIRRLLCGGEHNRTIDGASRDLASPLDEFLSPCDRACPAQAIAGYFFISKTNTATYATILSTTHRRPVFMARKHFSPSRIDSRASLRLAFVSTASDGSSKIRSAPLGNFSVASGCLIAYLLNAIERSIFLSISFSDMVLILEIFFG